MSKPKAKRKLLDELEATQSVAKSKKAKSKQTSNQEGKNLVKTKLLKRKVIPKAKGKKDGNNNAIPECSGKLSKFAKINGGTDLDLDRRNVLNVNNVVPITRTRAMKAKETIRDKSEIETLNDIDRLTNKEFISGNQIEEICHDGVELPINGSDLDDFEEDLDDATHNEPGEITSSDEDEVVVTKSPLVVAKATKQGVPRSRSDKFKHLKDDPDFRLFVNEIVGDQLASSREANTKVQPSKQRQQSDTVRDSSVHSRLGTTRIASSGSNNKNCTSDSRGLHNIRVNGVKSPSDTTIYTPALWKINQDDYALIEKISNFVESIRIDGKRNNSDKSYNNDQNLITPPGTAGSRRDNTNTNDGDSRRIERSGRRERDKQNDEIRPGTSRASSGASYESSNESQPDVIADQLLVQAERFKAKVEAPKGKNLSNNGYGDMLMPYDYDKLRSKFVKPEGLGPIDNEILFLRNFDQDDEFFHVTSQIDPGLKMRIERGEFVDLERLLPRDRVSGGKTFADDLNKHLYQMITQGTGNFVEPPTQRNSSRISNVRKWDQAFRVYAAIYTHANQDRASEIWQYVYVIHTAATANPWENVYYYDINFRELMASKPWRSWGKTYTQGWNMAFNNSSVNSYR